MRWRTAPGPVVGKVTSGVVRLFLGGDVMTGRGIDQILPSPGNPRLWEHYVQDARTYVALAERVNGTIQRPVPVSWPWGEALAVLDGFSPDVRFVNLETSITQAADPAPGKAVHYRMHPANVGCLTVAGLDACAVANNHVLDFGRAGLRDTLASLRTIGLASSGAGDTLERAQQPVVVPTGSGQRVLIAACGSTSSGIPADWAATATRPGVDLLPSLDSGTADELAHRMRVGKRPGVLAVVSIHWGSNWGYQVPAEQVEFARRLIDGGVDIVHGHSSHHPRPVELYRDKLILYGCGDLIDDYEGISGYEDYRSDLRLLYLATLDATTGRLVALHLAPLQSRQMRLRRADRADSRWLRELMASISHCDVRISDDELLDVRCPN